MGKGDKKTRKGKIFLGSYGKERMRKEKKVLTSSTKKYYSYKFVNSLGEELNPSEAVFPIITADRDKTFKFIGTGFFINAFGGFVTAKHVVFDNDEKAIFPFYVVQVLPNNKYVIRHVQRFDINPNSDAVVCMLTELRTENGEHLQNAFLMMKNEDIKVGDEIKTIAYPKSKMFIENEKTQIGEFTADWFRGNVVEEFPSGRDKSFLPGPCFQTSVKILGDASGGPVLNSEGIVVGINSTGYDFGDDKNDESISFITPISEVFSIEVPVAKDVKMTIGELSQHGSVKIK